MMQRALYNDQFQLMVYVDVTRTQALLHAVSKGPIIVPLKTWIKFMDTAALADCVYIPAY